MFDVILAIDKNNGIGFKNKLPWHCKEELKIFKEKTMNSIVITGRKTAETLPHLKNRQIICISRSIPDTSNWKNDVIFYDSLENCILNLSYYDKKIFIIGGKTIFDYVFCKFKHCIDTIHVSRMKEEYKCDTYCYFLENTKNMIILSKKKFEEFDHFELGIDKGNGEQQYLDIVEYTIRHGDYRQTRNSPVLSIFGQNMKFDLRNGFPLLTTKKMFFRGIFEELLFFIKGETNSKKLEEKNINIWKGNTDRQFLDSIGMTERNEGIMGPLYGYQWRHFNAEYDEENGTPINKGIDQLQKCIDLIKTNPTSRRIFMTSYNPSQLDQCVLPPCHSIVIQFYVCKNYLDMYCYNRSQDLFLGVPFNIASSALLLTLVSKITNLQPRMLHISMGDVHVYENHVSCCEIQIKKIPYIFPTLIIPNIDSINDINNLNYSDLQLKNYISHPKIKSDMIA